MTGPLTFFALVDGLLLLQLVLVLLGRAGAPPFFHRIHGLRGKQGSNPRHPRCPNLERDRSCAP